MSSTTLVRTMGSNRRWSAEGLKASRSGPHRRLWRGGGARGAARGRAGAPARRQEELVGVVEVVALAVAARERLPVLGHGLDVVEPGDGPDVGTLVVVQRRLVAQPPVQGIRVVELDERVPLERLGFPGDGLSRLHVSLPGDEG